MEVRSLTSQDARAYSVFVRDHPAGLLHYTVAYRDLVASELGCEHDYLIAIDGEEIRGVLPVMWRDDKGGRIYNSLPFYGSHGGPLADGLDAEGALWDRWQELASGADTLAATVVTNPLQSPAQQPVHTLIDERISQITPLPDRGGGDQAAVEESLLAIIDKSARYDIRKAIRSGVLVERGTPGIDDRLQLLASLHAKNMRALGGVPKSPEFFAAISRYFTPLEDFDVYVARLDGRVAAALLMFMVGHTAEYFTPAIEASHRAHQPLAAILQRAMTDAIQRGARRWNWGGTWETQAGLFRFKRKWGATVGRYRYYVTVNDGSLLDSPQADLQSRFSGFYVVPFQALRAGPDRSTLVKGSST